MVAYNTRILETSQSQQRRHRAERMLANLQPEIARLEREAAATHFDALVAERVRQTRLCTGCGKPRPDRGSPRCPDCVLEDQRLSAIKKLPALNDEEFEVVWSGKESLSKFQKNGDEPGGTSTLIGREFELEFRR